MGNPRYIKVAEQIKVIVAELLERRIKDPRLGEFVTVTDVRLTGDGRESVVQLHGGTHLASPVVAVQIRSRVASIGEAAVSRATG